MEQHPEEERPLGEPHHALSSAERRTTAILALGLIASLAAVPILAVMSLSPLGNVFIGLSPLIASLILALLAVSNHYKRGVLWFVLILTHVAGFGILYFLNMLLVTPINVAGAVGISFFLGLIVILLAWLSEGVPRRETHRRPPPVAFTPEALPDFVHSVEDKCKALNFAIGRVYRNSNGGSPKLRERLRIPRDWYNEFNEANEDERLARASVLVGKIHDRLLLYRKPEKELFMHAELERIKHLKRHADGTTPLIDVLKANDSDPVEHYYQAAMDACEQVLEGLGAHHNPYKPPTDSQQHQ